MKKEYAIIRATIENALEDGNEVVFKNQYPEYILAELINLDDDDNYIVEEYEVDEDGEFVQGSDFDTAENFKKRFGTWYAVCADDEDADWGYGSYDKEEALKMLKDYPAGHIDVVEMGNDPVCIEVLYNEDTVYKIRDGLDAAIVDELRDNVNEDTRWTRDDVKEDAENYGMTVEEFIDRYLEAEN